MGSLVCCPELNTVEPRGAALQMALFIGRNRKYLRPAEDLTRWHVDDRGGLGGGEPGDQWANSPTAIISYALAHPFARGFFLGFGRCR
jgi:hypothetical protein